MPGKTILIVDDERDILNLVTASLGPKGYQVLAANGGAQALQILDSHPDPIDLLLTDIMMPDMDGVALSEEVRRDHPSVHIVFMSGAADSDLLDQAQPLLLKPFKMDWLAEQLGALLETVDDGRTQT